MRQFLAILCLAGAFGLPAPAQSSLGLIQPDAGLVFGIEWRRIVDSSLGELLTDQIKSNMPPVPGMESLQKTLLSDLDSVLIASSASALSKGAKQPPVLVIVKGRFDVEQLRGLVPANKTAVEKYRGVDILGPSASAPAPGSKPADETRVAFLDANTILAGDRAEMRAAIDRIKTGKLTASKGGILAGVDELVAGNDVWMVVEIPASALKDAPPAAAQMLSGVKSTELGMSFRQGLGMQVNIRTADDAAAQSMQQALQGLIAMAGMTQSQSPQAGEVLKRIRITAENSRVKLALALDKAELEQIIKEMQSAKPAPKEAATAPRPEPSGPKSIRITGLDGGPVDVPIAEAKP